MIYGMNFNGLAIPTDVQRRFRKHTMVNDTRVFLKGVAQNERERDLMLLQANNGTRLVHVEKRRVLNGVWWFGIYCS